MAQSTIGLARDSSDSARWASAEWPRWEGCRRRRSDGRTRATDNFATWFECLPWVAMGAMSSLVIAGDGAVNPGGYGTMAQKPSTGYSGVAQIVHLSSSDLAAVCAHCRDSVSDSFDIRVNHYIQHGYHVLHIGQETELDRQMGHLWHSTVAVLGITDRKRKTLPTFGRPRPVE